MNLIPPGNPLFHKLHEESKRLRRRSTNKDLLRPPYRGDVKFCAWCNEKPVSFGRKKYCSQQCVDSSTVYFSPSGDLAFIHLLERQQCLCNLCGYNFRECVQQRLDRIIEYFGIDSHRVKRFKELPPHIQIQRSSEFLPDDRRIEIDHVIPVAMGGDVLGVDNVQALCRDCHAAKTLIDNINIRKLRRDSNAAKRMLLGKG